MSEYQGLPGEKVPMTAGHGDCAAVATNYSTVAVVMITLAVELVMQMKATGDDDQFGRS